MQAHARVVTALRAGRTVLQTVRSEPPITLRHTPDAVYWIGSAAGPLGGDQVCLDLDVAAGTSLTVRTAAAAIALRGDGSPSVLQVRATVGEGATLRWLPEPLISTAGSIHVAFAELDVAATAHVQWRDQVVRGRSGEHGGSYRSALRVEREKVVVLHHEVRTDVPEVDGPAVLDGARVVGNMFCYSPGLADMSAFAVPGVARYPLTQDAVLISALANDVSTCDDLIARADVTGRGRG